MSVNHSDRPDSDLGPGDARGTEKSSHQRKEDAPERIAKIHARQAIAVALIAMVSGIVPTYLITKRDRRESPSSRLFPRAYGSNRSSGSTRAR